MAKDEPENDPSELVPANFRAPRRLMEALDAWTNEINQTPRWPKMKRPDLIRGVLEWAVKTRPDWERGLAEHQTGQGETAARPGRRGRQ